MNILHYSPSGFSSDGVSASDFPSGGVSASGVFSGGVSASGLTGAGVSSSVVVSAGALLKKIEKKNTNKNWTRLKFCSTELTPYRCTWYCTVRSAVGHTPKKPIQCHNTICFIQL